MIGGWSVDYLVSNVMDKNIFALIIMSIGKNILKHRKAAGLSQADLAGKTMLSLRTIQRIENDKNRPRGYTIKVLA